MPEQDTQASADKKRHEQRALERQILRYLKVRNQPVNWNVLAAVYCDPAHTLGDIEAVLTELKDGHHIAVDEKKRNVTITEVGLMRLAAGMF